MNCRKAQSWFGPFLDQGLAAGKAENLMAHLRSCPGCARAWKRYRTSLGARKDLEKIEPSADFEANLWRRIREDAPESSWRRTWRNLTAGATWPRMAGAAAVASLVIGTLLVGGVLGPDDSPMSPSGAPSVAVNWARDSGVQPVVRRPDSPSMELVGSRSTDSDWEVPEWARTRSGRLERGFSGFEGMIDTAGVEPEFVIRRVSQDLNSPPIRAF